jgi:hypothetical protein
MFLARRDCNVAKRETDEDQTAGTYHFFEIDRIEAPTSWCKDGDSTAIAAPGRQPSLELVAGKDTAIAMETRRTGARVALGNPSACDEGQSGK